jgi:hypothetical protein
VRYRDKIRRFDKNLFSFSNMIFNSFFVNSPVQDIANNCWSAVAQTDVRILVTVRQAVVKFVKFRI